MTLPAFNAQTTLWTRIRRNALTQFVFALLCVGIPFVLANIVTKLIDSRPETMELRNAVKMVVLLMSYAVYVRYIEQRAVSELTLYSAWRESAWGSLLGMVIISVVVLVLFGVGRYHVDSVTADPAVLLFAAKCISIAVLEEILFRGLLFRLIERSLGSVIALLLSGLLFGLAHSGNTGANALSAINLVLLGVLFGVVYMDRRSLWACIGLHFSWNFAQGAIFGLGVSGFHGASLVKASTDGPLWLSGGEFGIEASILCVLSCIVATALLLNKSYRNKKVVTPFWCAQSHK